MDIFDIIQLAIILAISIGMHEYAHAYISYRLGDPTPKLQGRLTPNPIKHIDPIGFLMIFIAHFGWGKPVQINPLYYKNPRKGELMVALAGPATNLVLAIIGILVTLIYGNIIGFSGVELINAANCIMGLKCTVNSIAISLSRDIMFTFRIAFSSLNIALAIFNLIPIAPLDGYRLIKIRWHKGAEFMEKYSRFGIIVVVAIVLLASPIFVKVVSFVFNFLFTIIGQVFY